ncbi:MAG TPA: crotonase/enoyl-CoA hydratase family protein [Myxococcales bacterium]|nr:crotonase/enoyl-CoA hydratase family protein [Myxococcales bacterium]HIL80917.1 crotonase/enoyl-CoA hydratase family protein [Myxococcales bacterium]
MADEVLTERRDRVLLITLNRPKAKNSVNSALAAALIKAIEELDSDDGLSAGVLTGADGGFSAGMDLKAFATEGPPKGFDQFLRNGAKKPLIAAIEGFALAGGLEIALSCDLLVAAKGVRLGIPEVGVGLFAAGGALMRLPRLVPYGVAMEMALTGDPISVEAAAEYGMVARIAEPGHAVDEAIALATRIAKNAPLSVAASKMMIADSFGRTEEEFWQHQTPVVRELFASNDAKEGPRAFAEKRAPKWTGT